MPTRNVWIAPEVLLEHQGVGIFYTYKDNDYDQGTRCYWFTLNTLCGDSDSLCEEQPCRHVFDVRELSTWRPPKEPPFCVGANDTLENHAAWERYRELEAQAIRMAITTAIEQRELTPRGWLQTAQRSIQPPAATNKSTPGNSLG
jgi:hypothetical protein